MKTYEERMKEALELLASPSVRTIPKGNWSVEWREAGTFLGEGRNSPSGAIACLFLPDENKPGEFKLIHFKGQYAARLVSVHKQ